MREETVTIRLPRTAYVGQMQAQFRLINNYARLGWELFKTQNKVIRLQHRIETKHCAARISDWFDRMGLRYGERI